MLFLIIIKTKTKIILVLIEKLISKSGKDI
jgi:hypothetical protein